MNALKTLTALVLTAMLAACAGTEDHGGGGAQHPESQGQDDEVIPSFAEVFATVIKDRCATCHSAAGGNAHGINLETYDNVVDEAEGIVGTVENGDPVAMPPRRATQLSAREKAMLLKWVKAGTPLEGRVKQPEAAPAFDQVFATVLQPKCVRCHSASGGNRGGVNLETYETVFANRNNVANAVGAGFMPPRSQPQLTNAEAALLNQWLVAGAPR